MSHFRFIIFLPLITVWSCIGTDIIEGPTGNEKLELNPQSESLLVGQTLQMNTDYLNGAGLPENITPEFLNLTPSIIEVDETGLVTALSVGQGKLYATHMMINSDTARINVVGSETEVAEIMVSGNTNSISIGEEIILQAEAFTVNDVPISTSFEWSSENPAVASVTNEGVVSGLSRGITHILATTNNIEGRYALSVGLDYGIATFVGSSGYIANGTAELRLSEGILTLTLSEDFETSFALGTFIYLANSTRGPDVKANGFEVAEITMNGSHTFNLSEIAEAMSKPISLGEHMYVVILCEPASLTFGFGEIII